MTDEHSVKQVLFISHAYADVQIAHELQTEIMNCFHNVSVFVSSDPDGLQHQHGSDWTREILDQLRQADLVLVIATKRSLNRRWVWFEAGAAWKGSALHIGTDAGRLRTLRTVCLGIEKDDLPPPFTMYTALSLSESTDLEMLFTKSLPDFFTLSGQPKYEELAARMNDLEQLTAAQFVERSELLGDERWEQVRKDMSKLPVFQKEAVRLLLLTGPATDYSVAYRLRANGVDMENAGIVLWGIGSTTGLIEAVSELKPTQPDHVSWKIKPELTPYIERYFLEEKEKALQGKKAPQR